MPQDNKQQQDQSPKAYNTFIKYSSLGLQMLVTIAAFSYGGYLLDQHYSPDKNLWVIVGSLTGVVFSLVSVIFSLLKNNRS